MNNFIELLTFDFFRNALTASLLASVIAGIVGTYIVARRNVFISGGITHASFGGLGIAYFLGITPIIGAAVFAVSTALGIEWSTKKAGLREDSAIAILWSLGMAIGIIFVFLTPGYTPNLMGFLFGDILTVQSSDMILLGSMATGLIILTVLFYEPILFTAFDQEFAHTSGYPVKGIKYAIAVLVALSIVFSIKIMGIILVLSLFTIPPSAANLFSKTLKSIMTGSALISLTGSISGLIIAYFLDIPSGASIIFTLTAIYILLWLLKRTINKNSGQ